MKILSFFCLLMAVFCFATMQHGEHDFWKLLFSGTAFLLNGITFYLQDRTINGR